jgi:hypothetical protein
MKYPVVNLKSRKMLPQYTDLQLTTLAERVGLSLAELKLLHRAAHDTYQAIGYDLSEANGGKGIDRESLVEVVLDASYMEMYGRLTPEIKEWLKKKASTYNLSWVYAAVGAGFPFAKYE